VSLAEVPAVLMLVGLAAYAVLAGADFGAGLWDLVSPRERDRPLREHTHHAMAAVWEANHVWLIFVLVVCWTAYPVAFASIMSTLAAPLFVAAIGIILRGGAYALRAGEPSRRADFLLEGLFAVSSVLTPFALGAAIGGIASRRVPVGNAAGDPWTSWLNPTSLLIGVLAVAASAHVAAVFLTGDAARRGSPMLVRAFRVRALGSGVVAGTIALGGLLVLHADARPLADGLTSVPGVLAVLVSGAAGVATLGLVARGRFGAARACVAVAVAAIVAGWALAQQPVFLPGLTVAQAAAGHATLVWTLVSIAVGAVVLVPSLALLYGLVLRGRLDPGPVTAPPPPDPGGAAPRGPRLGLVLALAAAGTLGVVAFDAGPVLYLGVACLLAAAAGGAAVLLGPAALQEDLSEPAPARSPDR
jgi:cytochrome bd ubiquinol oxidase subunit II